MSKVVRLLLAHPSGERRIVSAAAASREEAVAVVEAQESKRVAYMIDPSEAAELEKKLRDGTLTGRDKARILTHQQDVPYVVQKAKE
jgi:hypothetical protein